MFNPNPTSMGAEKTYAGVNDLLRNHPKQYRKCYNFIRSIRILTKNRPSSKLSDEQSFDLAVSYAERAMKDYRLPALVKMRLRWAVLEEFGFELIN